MTLARAAALPDAVTDGALLDVDELCVLAGRTITQLYRSELPAMVALGRTVDAAHGRLYARTRGRGVTAADDVDAAQILTAAAKLRQVTP